MRHIPPRKFLAGVTVAGFIGSTALLSSMPTAHAAQAVGTFPNRLFHSSAPYYQKLPNSTPVAADSAALIADLRNQAETHYGTPGKPSLDVNHHAYSPTMYVARNTDPIVDFDTENCQGKSPGWDTGLKAQLRGIRVPANAQPDTSADGSMVLYNIDADTVTETWVTKKHADGRWTACWGGTIRNASQSQTAAFDVTYGASASGTALAATTIRAEELRTGRIDHMINLNLPRIKAYPAYTWPANRSDGNQQGTAFTMGQIMRLPANLDLAALKLSPSAYTIAKAAQDYGIMVTESAGSVTFGAQNVSGLTSDPYAQIFRGRWATQEMLGNPTLGEGQFPLDKLQALPVGYRAPVTNSAAPPVQAPTVSAPSAPTITLPPVSTPRPSMAPSTTTKAPTVAPTTTRPPTAPSPTTPASPSPSATTAPQVVRRIDAGSDVASSWSADTGFNGGWDYFNWQPIDRTKVTNPAPAEVYQSERAGMTGYALTGLVPGRSYTLRLHFAELYWEVPGTRIFNVTANSRALLTNFEVAAAAGGTHRAVVREFSVTADSSGKIQLGFTPVRDQPTIAGIELLSGGTAPTSVPSTTTAAPRPSASATIVRPIAPSTTTAAPRPSTTTAAPRPSATVTTSRPATPSATPRPATPSPTKPSATATTVKPATPNPTTASPSTRRTIARVNLGYNAVGDWTADRGSVNGWYYEENRAIQTTGVSGAAPQAVYQSERAGLTSWVATGLTPSTSYTARLHFAEIYWTAPGQRVFDVRANGTTLLRNFDIVAAAGGANRAVVREVTVRSDTTGRLVLDFVDIADRAKLSGVEIVL